jgi:RNA polymerase sigma-70 factor, ECF subfamily
MASDLECDRNLSERARGGDPAAWRAIYESTCERLFAFLCYQVGDRDEARDLLQDTYLQAFRRLATYRAEAPIEVWLRAIALGRSLDWKRVALRRLKRTTRLDEAAAIVAPDAGGVRFESEDGALRNALAALSPHQRAALLLREWEERSFHEIAGLLGCAESTARVHHTRARERMRAALGGEARRRVAGEWEGLET